MPPCNQNDATLVQRPIVLNMAALKAAYNSPKAKQARAEVAQRNQQELNAVDKSLRHPKAVSSSTQTRLRNKDANEQQKKQSTTPEQQVRQDYPTPAPVKSFLDSGPLMFMPGVGTAAIAGETGLDIVENGLNWANGLQAGLSLLPIAGPVAKSLSTATKDFAKGFNEYRLAKEIDNATPEFAKVPVNIGWGPKQTLPVTHTSNSDASLVLYNPNRWDVVNEGANPTGIWFQGRPGVPRTVENATPAKAEKAARARALFANRPYTHSGQLMLEKPLVTIGDVPNRSALSYQAEQMGADGIIYNNVYDNGFNNNQVILSFRKPSSLLTAQERLGIPKMERHQSSSYINLGQARQPHSRTESFIVENPRFGEMLGEGSEQTVYADRLNPSKVLKVYSDRSFNSLDEIKKWHPQWFKRNLVPFQEKMKYEGFLTEGNKFYPVYSQNRLTPLPDMTYAQWQSEFFPKIQAILKSKGFNESLNNGKIQLNDLYPTNVGYDSNGNIRFFDVDAY